MQTARPVHAWKPVLALEKITGTSGACACFTDSERIQILLTAAEKVLHFKAGFAVSPEDFEPGEGKMDDAEAANTGGLKAGLHESTKRSGKGV